MYTLPAALFDFDGVLVDTEPIYDIFWNEAAPRYALPSGFAALIKGQPMPRIMERYFAQHSEAEQQAILREAAEFEHRMPLPPMPGSLEFVRMLSAAGVRTGLVTSSDSAKIDRAFRELSLDGLFDTVVTADRITQGKPSPMCYLLAAADLNIAPRDCFVFEDSFAGCEAGRAAGMHVIALSTTNSPESLRDKADKVIPNFSGITLTDYLTLKKSDKRGFSTNAVHAGEEPNLNKGGSGDVVVPIHLSTTFARKEVDVPTEGYEYTRSQNPTRQALETKLASLENAKYGLAFSSGLAAETVLLLALVQSGDHIVALDDLYGGSKRLFDRVFHPYRIGVSYVDATDVSAVDKAICKETRLVWLESPSNPLLKVCDIQAIAQAAHKKGALLVVDNTFLSPWFQRPLDLGADVVVHSSTKYIGGHSDVLGGALLLSDSALYEKLQYRQNAVGAVLSPFDSYLTLRGVKTLALRMERHQANALFIARYLEQHPQVKRVIYPGLKSHPQYALCQKQATGFGGVLSFELAGDMATAKKFLEHLQVFALAESLGGVESLIELPAVMTHASVEKEMRDKVGITDTLIRLSVGIEDAEDLTADLSRAFDAVR